VPQVRADRQLALERSQRLAHMVGVNWFFTALTAPARRGGGELRQWQGERSTAEYLHDQPRMAARVLEVSPHPDGLGIWAEAGADIVFLLEYDTGSEHLPQLAAKLDRYAHLATDRLAFQVPILFCFPTPRREQNARRALASHPGASVLQIATAAFDPRVTCPAGPVWLPLRGWAGRPMRLIELDQVLPDPWRQARERDERERQEREWYLAQARARQHSPGSYPSDPPLADPYGPGGSSGP
jgi:Replication-relaxation